MRTSRFFLLLLPFAFAMQCLTCEGYAQSPNPGYEDFPVPIDEEHFPDENFRGMVMTFDIDGDGWISFEEASEIEDIDISEAPIRDLEGVKYFFALGYLIGDGSLLESLDLAGCASLRNLNMTGCPSLKSLDVSGCISLTFVEAPYCPFESVKCDGCVKLEYLAFGAVGIFTQMESLDVSSCVALTILGCSGSGLMALDLSANRNLEILDCSYNELTELDLSLHPKLTRLDCSYNKLTELEVSSNPLLESLNCMGCGLSELDISSNPELTMLNCAYNSLTELYLSSCPKLETLLCGSNGFVEFDASGCTSLKQLCIEENHDMASLDLSGCTSLAILDIGYSPSLTSLDVSNCSALMELNCGVRCGHNLEHLDVDGCSALKTLDCARNKLTELDLNDCSALTTLYCYQNALTSLDLTSNPALEELICVGNALTELDLTANTALVEVDCANNNLSELDVSKCVTLARLRCTNNCLRNLDLKTTTALSYLNCANNALAELELGSNTALQELYCHENALVELDLSKNTDLRILSCGRNALTGLDLHANTVLEQLRCSNNCLSHLDLTRNESLSFIECISFPHFVEVDSSYTFNLNDLPGFDISRAFGWYYPEDVQDSIVHFAGEYSLAGYYYDSGRDTLQFRLSAITPVALDSISFPDSVFRDYVSKNFDTDSDGFLSFSERNKVRIMDVSGMGIYDLQGIGCFSNLTELDCSDNRLFTLVPCDRPECNTVLTDLDCSGNHLTSLELSYYSRLKSLRADGNSLYVEVDDERTFNLMQLPDFDLAKAYDWQGGYVEDSILHFEEETVTYAYETGFYTVDSMPRFVLRTEFPVSIAVNAEFFPDEVFRAYVAEHIDKSGDGVLNEEEINGVITLNVSGLGIRDLTGIGYLVGLSALDCSDNELTSLDLSANAKLQILKAENNQLDISLDENDSFGLSALPGFDLAKASDWTGCTVIDSSLSFIQQEVTYAYATGYAGESEDAGLQSARFSLMADRDPSVDNEVIEGGPQSRVYAKDRTIFTEGIGGEVSVYTTVGTLVYKGKDTRIPVRQVGTYIVRSNGQVWKILVI